MAAASKSRSKMKFEPLMIAIEDVAKALGTAKSDDALRTAIKKLESKRKEYQHLCRAGHVVKDDNEDEDEDEDYGKKA